MSMERKIVLPRRLPIVIWKGQQYFVDLRLEEFRSVSGPEHGIEFVDFDSPKGRRMWEELVLFECPWCGTKNPANRHSLGLLRWNCRRELVE